MQTGQFVCRPAGLLGSRHMAKVSIARYRWRRWEQRDWIGAIWCQGQIDGAELRASKRRLRIPNFTSSFCE